ncbi:MAG: thioesterase family protein, partial [Syntrophomonadaceae bacterium]|nr:thioesterase family protein [Syntrophomonadaceae bacterium]
EGMFRIFNPRSSVEQMNLAIVSLSVDYLSEMYYGQEVQVLSQVKRVGKSSLEIYQEIYQGGQLCARGTTTFVHFNYRERRPQPIPPSVVEKLREHLVADS